MDTYKPQVAVTQEEILLFSHMSARNLLWLFSGLRAAMARTQDEGQPLPGTLCSQVLPSKDQDQGVGKGIVAFTTAAEMRCLSHLSTYQWPRKPLAKS